MARNPEHYAIVIGIDRYGQLPPQGTAVRDALRFTEWLKSDEGGGLPRENIKLMLSPRALPDNPSDARPAQYHIDNALYKMGTEKGGLVGQRLYFYFSGRAVGTGFDDLAMLMASASPEQLNHNIGLDAYRRFFRASGLFEEVVFILDCPREKVSVPFRPGEPSFTLPAESRINVCDFLLLAAPSAEKASETAASESNERSGLMTRALLEGLDGAAADNSGRITSTSVGAYIQRRVSELANNASLNQVPQFILPNREIVFAEDKLNEKETGAIVVEVPHWSSVVTIYDNSMREILVLAEMQEDPKAPGKYFAAGKLLKGIYLVEVTLEGKSQKELAVVFPDQTTTVSRSIWKKLRFVSHAPLGGKEGRRKLHARKAFEHSRKPTWQKPGGGNFSSRLFLFVRTSEPQRYPLFHAGLSLKRLNEEPDASGQIRYTEEIITDFPENAVKIDKETGWMAFCADLEPGFYILQKHRAPHKKRRQQPIYLCAGWETQVFISARSKPSLRKLSLSMADFNAGFNPDDESAEAAEAVLEAISRDDGGSNGRQLVTRKKIIALLKSERKNPWLGILAAYALRPQLSEDEESKDLFDEIISFLQSAIGDHPDVRALGLIKMQPDATASEMAETIVFKEPPLLRAGFKIVQEQALKISRIIQPGSLTERLIGKILTDTPWTAWRELDVTQLSEKEISHPQNITPALIEAAAYLQTVSPKAPVIRLSNLESVAETPATADAASDTLGLESMLTTPTPVTAHEASLIKLVQDLTQTGDLDALEETYTLDSNCVDDLLNNVNAEEISAASGVPLARTEEGLQSLREKHKTQAGGGFTEEISQTPVENLVLGYALKKSTAAGKTTEVISLGDSPENDLESMPLYSLPHQKAAEPAAPPVTIEECVSKLKAEADRLVSPWTKTEKSEAETTEPPDDEYLEKAKGVAERLYNVADSLLAAAAFTATTDIQGQVTYGNGAFIELITPRRISFNNDEQRRLCEANKQLFGEALSAAPLGTSVFANPIPESIYREFKLQRSEIKEGATQTVQAYLNVLRVKNASSVNTEALQKIDSGLSELRLYASLFAHGTSESRSEYYKKLVEMVKKFQQAALESCDINNINITDSLNPEGTMMDNTANEAAFGEADEIELSQAEGTLYGREFWGISRHELIAGAAMELLTTRAQLEVRRILAPIGVLGLEDVAGWADRLKGNISNPDAETVAFLNDDRNDAHGTWHFVNVPHGAESYSRTDYPQFTRDDDVVQMIKHSVLVLKGESDRFSELNALRWLAHLVGDVHQPVHVGCGYIDESSDPPRLVSDPQEASGLNHDRGGNQIQLPAGATLHSYWDSRILDDADDHFHEGDAPESDAALAAEATADEADADPELKKRFIQKLVGRIKSASMPDADAPENEMAGETTGLAPEDWAEVWATESIRLAREAYQSLEITRKQGNKFKVNWEGKEAYDARCKPIAQQQVDAAARNLAAVLNAIWAEI